MKKKFLLFITLFFIIFTYANAEQLINYDWSFYKTNNNYGYGLNNVLVENNKYYTWHLDKNLFINIINEYNENGELLNSFEPNIKEPIIDLINYDDTFIAIDRIGTIYKLDYNFKITKEISNQEKISIINDKSELKISNNTIYYIDKTNFNIYSSDYQLNNYNFYNLDNIASTEELFNKVTFLSQTDKMYFKYFEAIANNDEDTIIIDILKSDKAYFITSATQKDKEITASIKLVDENLNVVWLDNYFKEIPIKVLLFNDYIFVLSIDVEENNYNIKVYNSDYKFIVEEKFNLKDNNAIPISIIGNDKGILIKSKFYESNDVMTIALNENYNGIIIDKYSVNIFNIKKIVNGEGVIEAKNSAIVGDIVPFQIIAKEGYVLDKLSIKDSNGNSLPVTDYTFIMPTSDITISAIFVPKNPNTEDKISYIIPILLISFDILLLTLYEYKRCKN